VLKRDGLAYATFFLYSEAAVAASRQVKRVALTFEHSNGDGCFVNDPDYPT
jgi:hypothetical protein